MKHGGKRSNAGRKRKFGTMKTKAIRRTVPVEWIEELDKWLEERIQSHHG